MVLNLPGYTLLYDFTSEATRSCLLIKGMNVWQLSQFSCRDLVAAKINHIMDGIRHEVVVCLAYFSYDAESLPLLEEVVKLQRYCKNKGLSFIVGCDPNSHHIM